MEELKGKEKSALKSINPYQVVLPVLIGILVVAYLLWRRLDWNSLLEINWNNTLILFVGVACLIYVFRHLVLAWRLKMLSHDAFSWLKSIELIFVWEFASAVSPTSLGGSAVAMFFLSQEKIKSAKSVTIVLYSIVMDSLYFLVTIPLLFMILGPKSIRPNMTSLAELDAIGITFLIILFFMVLYTAFFYYGLFIDPTRMRRFIIWLSRLRILKRYRWQLRKTGNDIVKASKELAKETWMYHIKIFTSTFIAWFLRFAMINAIIIGIVSTIQKDFWTQLLLFSRSQNLFVESTFTPTPGASGFSEILFGGFYKDFISVDLAIVVAIIWRLITYYSYLFLGIFIVPNWIRKVILKRNKSSNENE